MQSSQQPSTSRTPAFIIDPVLATEQVEPDSASVETTVGTGTKKKKKKPKTSDGTVAGTVARPTLFQRILERLQDDRLASGDLETARKLQEINRSQNASNIILKKVLNIAFVTTGVALLLSVIFVIIYTSIVKQSSKDDDEVPASMIHELNGGEQMNDYKEPPYKNHVHSKPSDLGDTVLVDSVNLGDFDGDSDSRAGESSPSDKNKRPPGNKRAPADYRLAVTRCRAVPLADHGKVKIGQICFPGTSASGADTVSQT